MIRIAKAASYLFHPLLMTTYAAAIVLNGGSYLTYTTGANMQRFIYGFLLLGTFILPGLLSLFLWKNGKVSSLEMPKREERTMPFIMTMFCYILVLFLLWKLPIPRLILFIVSGGFLAIIWSFFITLRWKISIHMTGIGGLMGLVYGISYSLSLAPLYVLMAMAIVAGLLGTSRMLLKAHTPAQVYIGFLSGFLIELLYCFVVAR